MQYIVLIIFELFFMKTIKYSKSIHKNFNYFFGMLVLESGS